MKFFNQKQLAITLTMLGAIPLLVGGLCVFLGIHPGFMPADPALVLHTYAVVIASFVAGMHWGIHFCKRTTDSVYLLSSVVAVVLWLSFIYVGQVLGLGLVMLSFILLWVEEYRLSEQRVTTLWFWHLRNIVSAIAVISLLLGMFGN